MQQGRSGHGIPTGWAKPHPAQLQGSPPAPPAIRNKIRIQLLLSLLNKIHHPFRHFQTATIPVVSFRHPQGYGITDAASATALSAHTENTTNPHGVTKSQLGLGNVENTALSTWPGSSNITTLGIISNGMTYFGGNSYFELGARVQAIDSTPNGSTYIGGGEFQARNDTAGQFASKVAGAWAHGQIMSNATSVNVMGIYAQASASTSANLGNGTTIAAGSFYATSTSGGTRDIIIGVDSKVWTLGGNTTNAYGLRSNVGYGAGPAPQNGFGIYIGDILATNAWGIYQADANAKNYFAGPTTFAGNLTMSSNSTLALTGNATISGSNTGDQDLSDYPTKSGNETISGNWNFSGNVTLSLAESVTFERVNIGSADYGWRFNPAGGGQVEFVFPGGTAAFYETGTPKIPYMYFPGTVQADYLVGAISGVTINADGLSGMISNVVMSSSLTGTLASFLEGQNYSGAAGIPYVDGGVTKGFHPTPADSRYYMTVYVVNGGTDANSLSGQYRSPVQFSADTHPSATASLDFPSIAAGGSQSLTITVSGAVTTNTPTVQLGWAAALPAGLVVSHSWVSAANTVTITLSNITGAAIDPAAITCRAAITPY